MTDYAYGQGEARGILAVNPYAEGSAEWHAWGLGYDYADITGGMYAEPLSGEWSDTITLSDLYRRVSELVGGPGFEFDDEETDWVAEAFETGYDTYVAGWRI